MLPQSESNKALYLAVIIVSTVVAVEKLSSTTLQQENQ